MDKRLVTALRALGAVLVLATAAYHLQWGIPRALIYTQAIGLYLSQGTLPDVRPFLFILFGIALLAGPYLVTRDVVSLRRGYQLGMLAMVLSILAWATWHLTGHAAFLYQTDVQAAGEASHAGVVQTLVDHYVQEPVEGAIKTIELGAAMAFGALLRWDPAVRDDGDGSVDDAGGEGADDEAASDEGADADR